MPTEPDAKQTIRERVRSRLAQAQASPDPHGRIPDFVGAAAAAERLAELPAWQHARVIKATLTSRSCRYGFRHSATASSSTWRCRSWLTRCRSSGLSRRVG